jgi:hypothetical protein
MDSVHERLEIDWRIMSVYEALGDESLEKQVNHMLSSLNLS